MNNWLKKFLGILITVLSFIGFEYKSLATVKNPKTTHDNDNLMAQSCPPGSPFNSPLTFAEVVTQRDPLNVRSDPNGRIIGQLPKGWQVVVLQKDASGEWTYIDNYYGVRGWVKTAYLKYLGEFCNKPLFLNQELSNSLLANQTILLNEEWLQLGDRIARNISKQ